MSHDRSRTYWTPTMERYFIDLMLEHMHRGNRIGHTFNKQAWTDMLSDFNAKFGSQYDKDVLKSRYTNLWKQFNDVKELLGQSGFSWDETREMVVADDYVWNAYLKVHPDARSYRTKAVLNFNDLCSIYGYTSADGRYSRSSHDVDFDGEFQAENVDDRKGRLAPLNDRPRTEWTVAMDQYFLELMLDQIVKGNKKDNTFNKHAWTEMLACFNSNFGPQHCKRVLRHRYKKLSKYCEDMKYLLKQNGFSWDDMEQMIVADDDVWDAYIKAHPHARAYRMKTLPNYDDLILVFGDSTEDKDNTYSHQRKDNRVDVSTRKEGEGNGRQTLTSTDRTRTYWTPPMDRYLIDLLLEQVHRGNKLGQTFISQAWVDMVTSFNFKFQSHHDKDVLKNRYKHLRRIYNDVKNLLQDNGFSWDETREMITAEDYIWDAYTEERPDARSYRVKTIPGYRKLCVIFGQENLDRRYSRLSQNVDSDEDTPVLIIDESSVDPIDWQPAMDRYLIDLMLEQLHGGNKIGYTFNEQAWALMVESFNVKFRVLCSRYILENRYATLSKEFDDISSLLSQSGFAWNASQQKIIADDAVWEAYIQERPHAIVYRNKVLENYIDLCHIQRNGVSNIGDQGLQLHNENDVEEVSVHVLLENVSFPVEEIQVSNQQKKRPTTALVDKGHSSKMQKISSETQKALSDTADALKTSSKRESKGTIEYAIETLQAIPGIDDELLLDACDLMEDDKKAKTFLALDASLRKKWLLRKLRP